MLASIKAARWGVFQARRPAPSWQAVINTFKVDSYLTYDDRLVLGFEILLLAFIVYYTVQEFIEIVQNGFFEYFSEGW